MSADRAPLPVLTSLRFFAAAEVVAYHTVSYSIGNPFLRNLVSNGYEAVTFFFVLSGFILTYVYSDAKPAGGLAVPARVFWRARVARILPAYLLGLLIALPYFVYTTFISKVASVPAFVVGIVLVPLFLQAWWPPEAMAWNWPAWSLSVEAFFYACFPMLIVATRRLPVAAFLLAAFGLVVATALVRYALSTPEAPFDTAASNFDRFFPLYHLPQFIAGVALGRAFLFGRTPAPATHGRLFAAGVVGVLVLFAARSVVPAWLMEAPVLTVLYGAIVFGGAGMGARPSVLTTRALLILGEASYAMYILHWPLAWWWNWLTRSLHLPPAISFALYFAVLTGLSILVLNFVERPLRRRILGHREHRDA